MKTMTSIKWIPWFATVIVAVLLSGSGLLALSPVVAEPRSHPAVQGTLSPRAFLPIVMKNYCSGIKCWSGVHLGNRTNDWTTTFLQRIDPVRGGIWPHAVVVLSNQVYQINRYPSTHPTYPCRVQSASVRTPIAFDYIKRAAQAGVRVVIRIYPSPGNFYDWNDPNQPNHHLSTGLPVGPKGYCRPDLYRSKADVADEMGAIHNLNATYGFSEFGFEPANEPNVEWYRDAPQQSSVLRSSVVAWQEMDAYFSAIYDWAHAYYPGVRVLTPPMGQGARAESTNVNGCGPMGLADAAGSGYDHMPNTYGTKNDGVNWHNYWVRGKEVYNFCPAGQHVSIYFPQWMRDAIRNGQKPVTISEADLASPQQGMGNPLADKWQGSNASLAADSIRHFFDSEQEFGVSHYGVHAVTVSWLLTDNTGNTEHDWHKAYYESGFEREWFRLWYLGQEPWP